MEHAEQIERIKTNFIKSRKFLQAIGDESRQLIITVLMEAQIGGMRVGEITAKTHLSRPAVSHHIKILRECGLVIQRKHGTMNFYQLFIGEEFSDLLDLFKQIHQFWIISHARAFCENMNDVMKRGRQ